MKGKERLKAVGWSALFLIAGYVFAFFLLVVAGSFIPRPASGSLGEVSVEALALLFSFAVLTWLIGIRGLKLTAGDFGLASRGGASPGRFWVRGFGWGFLLGLALAALALVLAVPLGHAGWRSDGGTVPQWLGKVLLTLLVLFPAALAEELAFRGVPLIVIGKQFGRAPAIAALAVLFALAHLDNPGITGLGVANIALAGVLLGAAFFSPGGLVTSTGLHLGWNLTLAGLAAPVSGFQLAMPWLDYAPGGPPWLTGGGFGPEGGMLASCCLLGGTMLAARRIRPERVA